MSNLSNTNHEIYKRRGRMNIQIGVVLGVFVLLVMIATIAKLSTATRAAEQAQTEQTQSETTQ